MSDKGRSYHDDTSLNLDGSETVVGPVFLSFRRIDGPTFDIVSRMNNASVDFGKVSHFVFSTDGRTLTETKTQTLREIVREDADRNTGAVLKTSTFVLVFSKTPGAE
jgi:hypothetical protein